VEIKYHLDESVHGAVGIGLRLRGIDVTTAADAALIGAADADHLAYAHREGRVAVSCDSDFLRLDAAGVDHAGIVYFPQSARTVGQIVNALTLLRLVQTAEGMHARVEYL
jgi:hypothetical protein